MFISHVDVTGIDGTGHIVSQSWKFEYPTGTTHDYTYADKPDTPPKKVANFYNVVQHMKIRETLAMFNLVITKNPTDVSIVNGFLAGLDEDQRNKRTTCVYCDAGAQTLTKDVVGKFTQ